MFVLNLNSHNGFAKAFEYLGLKAMYQAANQLKVLLGRRQTRAFVHKKTGAILYINV
jgi:hypothetical protein